MYSIIHGEKTTRVMHRWNTHTHTQTQSQTPSSIQHRNSQSDNSRKKTRIETGSRSVNVQHECSSESSSGILLNSLQLYVLLVSQ